MPGGEGALSEVLRQRIEEEMGKRAADFSELDQGYKLGQEGAVFVAEKLRGNTVVEFLNLTNCRIGAVGASALAESLSEGNATLKKLWFGGDFDFNFGGDSDVGQLGDDGVQAIAQMLTKNTTLEELEFLDCVGVEGARALGVALPENDTLEKMNFGDCNFGNKGLKALAEGLQFNESVTEIELNDCQVTAKGAQSILETLRRFNSTLTSFAICSIATIDGLEEIHDSIDELLEENLKAPATAERRARCLLFCCLHLAPTAHEHAVPSIGAVPVPVMQYAVEHAGKLHVAKRFRVESGAVGQSSSGKRLSDLYGIASSFKQPAREQHRFRPGRLPGFEHMYKTKQTARKSTGGRIPRKHKQQQQQRFDHTIVRLNVGGKLFTTSLGTLLAAGDGSYLAFLVERIRFNIFWLPVVRDDDGAVS